MTTDLKIIHKHFLKHDPVIANQILGINFSEWFKPQPHNEHELFTSLCRIIVGQQLSGKAANAIYKKFCSVFTKKEPTPKKVLSQLDQSLRDAGLSWAKVKYIKDLAQHFVDKKIQFNELQLLSDEEVITELTKVKGIGRWSAEMYLMFTLHRENIFAYDDLGLNKGLVLLYRLKTPTRNKIAKIVDKWTPYKSFGSIALWNSLDNQ